MFAFQRHSYENKMAGQPTGEKNSKYISDKELYSCTQRTPTTFE